MKYSLQNPTDVNKAITYFEKLVTDGKNIELKEVKVTRTQLQNRALHLYFTFITNELNELGLEFNYEGLNGNSFGMRYTPHLVKEFIWRPIQIALFDEKTTTKINTKQMNEVIDVITKFFGDKGIELDFPSIETLIEK